MQNIQEFIARRFGFAITGHGYTKTHHTITRAEALQWLAAYPEGAVIYRQTLRGPRFIAARRDEVTA